jgi:hypothetical protein
MKLKSFLVATFLLLTLMSEAQNARFSQVWSAPIQFNPALTGRFDGKIRVSALTSWQSANGKDLSTQTIKEVNVTHQNVSLDLKLGKYRSSGDEQATISADDENNKDAVGKDKISTGKKTQGYWGLGLNYYSYGDPKSPISGKFYSLSLSRHFYNKTNRIYGFGVQVTNAQGSLDENKGRHYSKEISGGGFRYPYKYGSNNNPDSPRVAKGDYIDCSLGGYYGRVTESVMFEITGAFHHIFQPYNDLYNKNDADKPGVRVRATASSLLRLKLNSTWGIVQRNLFWQEGLYYRSRSFDDSLEITALWSGLEFFKVNPKKSINANFGIYTRSFRTMMPYVNVGFGNNVNLRCSYEHPINSIRFPAYSAKRTEVALIVTPGRQTKPAAKFYQKLNFW